MKEIKIKNLIEGYMVQNVSVYFCECEDGYCVEELYFDDKTILYFDSFFEGMNYFKLCRRRMHKDLVLMRYIELEHEAYDQGYVDELSEWVDMENGSFYIEEDLEEDIDA